MNENNVSFKNTSNAGSVPDPDPYVPYVLFLPDPLPDPLVTSTDPAPDPDPSLSYKSVERTEIMVAN